VSVTTVASILGCLLQLVGMALLKLRKKSWNDSLESRMLAAGLLGRLDYDESDSLWCKSDGRCNGAVVSP